EAQAFPIHLEPPGLDNLTKLESERGLRERLRQEARDRFSHEPVVYPDEPVMPKGPLKPREFAPMVEVVEPHYVCYGRLFFEQINGELWEWALGFRPPLIAAGMFSGAVVPLPSHAFPRPCEKYECSAGFCLRGDRVPLSLSPPGLSLSGAAAQA